MTIISTTVCAGLFENSLCFPLIRICVIAFRATQRAWVLKILQAGLQQHMNHELQTVQAGFRKGRGTRDQIANIHWVTEKAREYRKNIYFCFIDYAKVF